MNGKLIINKPSMCPCFVTLDGEYYEIEAFNTKQEYNIPYGVHKINVGIEILDDVNCQRKVAPARVTDMAYAWKEEKEVNIDDTVTIIDIKRKWHLLKHVTAEATINK